MVIERFESFRFGRDEEANGRYVVFQIGEKFPLFLEIEAKIEVEEGVLALHRSVEHMETYDTEEDAKESARWHTELDIFVDAYMKDGWQDD